MANSAAILSTSLPLNKKLKPELQAIARALGITDNATVPSLRKSINEHIRNHAEIADDPRFLPLLAHRSGPKTVTKNSADKLAELSTISSSSNFVATDVSFYPPSSASAVCLDAL
jgi:hypothetical protein